MTTIAVRRSLFCRSPALARGISTGTNGGETVQKASSYSLDLVKTKDYEGYLVGLLFPAQHRRAYFAVRAFNVEIATIRDQVPRSALQAGRMRFQFWRDALTSLSDNRKLQSFMRQPVAQELEYLVSNYDVNVRWLERSLEARYSDLSNNATYQTYDELENYAEFGHSSLLYLLLEILNVKDENIQFAASHIGVGNGLTALIRGHAHHARNNTLYMPRETMKKFGLREGLAVKDNNPNADERKLVQDVVHDMASQAFAQLEAGKKKFNESDRSLRSSALPALLSCIPAEMYLDRLNENGGFDPFLMDRLEQQNIPLYMQMKLLYAKTMKKL